MASVEQLLDKIYEVALSNETTVVVPYSQGRLER